MNECHQIQELDSPMFGSNQPAWHGLGTVVAGQPDAESALKLAGMDYDIGLEQVGLPNGKGGILAVPGHYVTTRLDLAMDDARRVLGGTVSERYTPIPNRECFEICDFIAGEGGAAYETCGTLNNGRRAWMLMRMPNSISVAGDRVDMMLLASTKHDGTGALEFRKTPVRVVCANTWAMTINGTPAAARIIHTKNKDAQIKNAKAVLEGATEYFDKFAKRATSMAAKSVDDRFAAAFVMALIPDPEREQKWSTATRKRERIMDLFKGEQAGGDHPAVKGTAWGLLNAFGEYVDHERTTLAMNGATKAESRMQSVVYGSGARLKEVATGLLTRVLEPSATSSRDEEIDALMASFDLNKSKSVDELMASFTVN